MNAAWVLHRFLTDHARTYLPFLTRRRRVLALSAPGEIPESQLYPFVKHRSHLPEIEFRELPLSQFLLGNNPYRGVDTILLQTWFNLGEEELHAILDRIEMAWPRAPVIYLDWFAPSHLRYAHVLNARVTRYVKKQILAEFSQYERPTRGDSNLTDYYSQRYGIDLPERLMAPPGGFSEKLVLGTGFECSPTIDSIRYSARDRQIDVHARFATNGIDWYQQMRSEAKDKVKQLHGTVVYDGRAKHETYINELLRSRVCFSPFGYGEICWRDFEAMATGSVLVKPDVSHLKLRHNFFVPHETYAPVKWDLSDLDQVIGELLSNKKKRNLISTQAKQLLEEARTNHSLAEIVKSYF